MSLKYRHGKRRSRDDRPLAAGEKWWSLLLCHRVIAESR